MPSLKTYIDSPLFYDGVPLAASDVNILMHNAEAIKTASLRSAHVLNIHRNINVTNNNGYIFKGGFQYRTGLTTARLVIWSKQVTGMGTHDIVVYFNAVEVARFDSTVGGLNVGGYTTVNVAIDTKGYIDYEIVTVTVIPVRKTGSGDASQGEQYVFDAYTFPWSSVGNVTWPSVPTFGSVNAANLNKLSNALDYLAVRVGQIPYPLQMNMYRWNGYNNPRYSKIRYFKAKAANQNNWLNMLLYYQSENLSYIHVKVGSVTWSYGPYAKGTKTYIPVVVDIIAAGLSWNTDYLGTIEIEIVSGHYEDSSDGKGGYVFGRIDSNAIAFGPNPSTGYTMADTPSTSVTLENLTYEQLQGRLTDITNIVSTAYTNVTTTTHVYDRAYMFRSGYGITDEQNNYYATTFIAGKYRAGDVLWIKGSDIKIGYGPITFELRDKDKINGPYTFTCLYEETLIESDTLAQSYVYLDQFAGLYQGQQYFVYGKDLHYAAETLR